jgi:16S rRNA (cytosine1402-N4)-methyltransferase
MALIQGEGAKVGEGFSHRPVLLHETVRHLVVRPGGVYIDCTVGEGGHASDILQAAMPGGRLLGIDLDSQAIERARHRLQSASDPQAYEGSFTLTKGSYAQVEELADSLGFSEPDGIFLDLGLSSLQLESQGRGFSLQRDEPLDMRYDPETALTAVDIVNRYPLEELARAISQYGEEPRARSIARAITQRRPLRTTLELADLVAKVSGGRRGRIHPATRTFQALRITVNSELDNLKAGLQQSISLLNHRGSESPGGMLVVISYHSLEDRIVKETMAREARGCICPPRVPICTCGHTPSLKVISRRVITPSPEEVRENPRSRSARMRVAERLQEK